jgi:hypothetical protein
MAKQKTKRANRIGGNKGLQPVAQDTTKEGWGPISLLNDNHPRVEALFEQYETADGAAKANIVEKICVELPNHTHHRDAESLDEEPLNEPEVEHDTAKLLIDELMSSDGDDEFCNAMAKALEELIKTHAGRRGA